ncbi:MAG TPA: biotin/lipoyl-binding protein, partial [Thermoanaerobaculia bacterium]
MRRRTKIIIGIVVLIVAGGLTVGFVSQRGKDVTPVTFSKVQRQDLTSKVSANGRIDAKRKVDLSANVMGQVVNLAVREGDVVKKDDFLLQIDQKQLAATARSADAALQAVFSDRDASKAMAIAADQDYQRALKNFDQKIIPRADLDRAQSARDSARANVMALEQRISQARENLNAAR